jgi:hypothetical protein
MPMSRLHGSVHVTTPFTSVFVTVPKNWRVKLSICDGRVSQSALFVGHVAQGLQPLLLLLQSVQEPFEQDEQDIIIWSVCPRLRARLRFESPCARS